MVTIWKDVVGYEEYFAISSCGMVYSKRAKKELVLGMSKTGYKTLSTRIGGRSGVDKCFKIHRLVADAFVPKTSEERVFVNHIDGDKLNNDYRNLEWCTIAENNSHARLLGLSSSEHLLALNKSNRKLSDEDVMFIRKNYKPYCKENGYRALSRKYSVTKNTIEMIIKNMRYLDVV